jgi:hypothetical protein
MSEDSTFIMDPNPNMTNEDKNLELSAKLAVAPCRSMEITRIERDETSGQSGWWIYYIP